MDGLTASEVLEKRKKFGYNQLPDRDRKSIIKIVVGLMMEPMIFLLLAVVAVYFILGDPSEAAILMVSVLVIISINLYQDLKTEKALEALRNLSSPVCDVIRDGKHASIPSRELVPGDIILVNEGSRVPADARLLSAQNLAADESLLTGESLPVDKKVHQVQNSDTSAMVFSSSMVVKGHGIAKVIAIGVDTEVGKIGDSLNKIKPEKTLINREVDYVVRVIAAAAIGISLIITVVYWLTRGDLIHGFLAGLTLAISILPEELPVVLTVFMALGAWRLAKSNVLSRNSSTIETLGAASVLCTDKTGTLTENRMTIVQVSDANGQPLESADKRYHHIISYGVLASQIKPFDPMEEAFLQNATEILGTVDGIRNGYKIVKEYPLEEDSLSVAHVWGESNEQIASVALKGAPEEVARLCGLSVVETEKIQSKVTEFAREGLRVLGVAEGEPTASLPDTRESFSFKFLGLVALADPIRPEAADAIRLCHEAGIRVIMITGDFPETARRIGKEVGLDDREVITGSQFSEMTQAEQDEVIRRVAIFSRVVPAHKLTIVESLKRNGEVVAMTGDGVNDSPALKSANIGIAMGNRGTDVAREASSIVLLDDNFASIVKGVRLGRRIFDNLQKAMSYIIAVHIPIIAMSLAPVLLGWPLVLLPIHIVFLEFIIDPSCTLIFEGESEDPGVMKRPPRRLNTPLFNKQMVISSVAKGLAMSLVAFVTHFATMTIGWSDEKSRALTFLLIVLMNLAMIVVVSGKRAFRDAVDTKAKSPMIIVLVVAMIALSVIYFIPPVTELFKFEPLTFVEVMLAGALAITGALGITVIRMIMSSNRTV